MELTVAGAGPAFSRRPGAIGSSYVVRAGGDTIVLDLGHGTFSAVASLVEPSSIAAVAISHLHPDHFIDLVALRHYLRWGLHPNGRIRVVGPAELAHRLDGLHAEPGFAAAALDIAPVPPAPVRYGHLELVGVRVRHTDDSYAYRVSSDGGPGLVYSGDCGHAGDLEPLIRPGDVLLVEASFGPGPSEPDAEHLDGPAIAELCQATRPGRILLTHILDGRDRLATIAAVRACHDVPVQVVQPGFAIEI